MKMSRGEHVHRAWLELKAEHLPAIIDYVVKQPDVFVTAVGLTYSSSACNYAKCCYLDPSTARGYAMAIIEFCDHLATMEVIDDIRKTLHTPQESSNEDTDTIASLNATIADLTKLRDGLILKRRHNE